MNSNCGVIKAICISEKKGTQKTQIPKAEVIENWGIKNDAHAGKWHRQVSFLGFGQIEEFKKRGADVSFGAFGENLVVDGFRFKELPVGTIFTIGDVKLEMTQIGKECHSHCEIYKKVGDCIMPREGCFARVLKGGVIMVGDRVVIE
ncbi:MAG: MOSC domain-containing protein [Eubacterium sp.]|nr:MOSC domain-containing protein [Eubacterium sp.]